MAYNDIYEKLTSDPNDLVGALAYIIYKQQKVEFCKSKPNGNPTKEQIEEFHAFAGMDTSIAAYRAQAQLMATAFLNAGLDELVSRTEQETRQDVLYTHISTVSTGLKSQLDGVTKTLEGKRTFWGWARDVTGNLVVNVVTIFVVGAIVLGYKFLSDAQPKVEHKAGLSNSDSASSAAQSASAN